MIPENRKKTLKILSLMVTFAGLAVIIGWFLDIGFLKSIRPEWVTMKITTAMAFVLSGITLFFVSKAVERELDVAQVVLSVTALLIILFMGTQFFSAILEVRTGIEGLFVEESSDSPLTVVAGRVSLLTMFNFLLIASAGILAMLNPTNLRLKLKIIGFIISLIGLIAVTGYIIDRPVLYYYFEGINTAMACHTAVLFVVLGIGFLCL